MSTPSLNYTYIYFDVHDYTHNSVLSSYTLDITPLKFIPDFTTSSIISGAQSISSKTLRWDFGDGAFSTDLSPTHVYQWPGEYNVTLTVYDASGNAYDSSFSSTIQIHDFISTQISFKDYKSLIYDIPVGKIIDPLTVNTDFSWQSYRALSATGYTINLYASGARGAYNYVANEQKDKWSHLRSLSRFYTLSTINGVLDYVTIESIQPNISEIYANIQNNQLQICQSTDPGSVLVGVTGSCQFWYTDDIPSSPLTESSPIIIFASIDNSKFNDAFTQRTNAYNYISYLPISYQNIDPAVFPSVKTRYNPADHLSITTTGIDGEGNIGNKSFDIPYISWQNTEIPYVIKFKDDQNFTTKNYPPLSSSIVQNSTITPRTYYDVQTGVVYDGDNGQIPLEGVTFYEDFAPQAPQSIGAFYKGYFLSEQSTENCYLTASVTVIDQPFYLKDALINWIAIPQYNSALRILRQDNYNGFNNNLTVSFGNTSYLQTNASNTYAITVAPSGINADNDYNTWFADPVNDQILNFDVNGNLLDTYSLSAMVTLVNNQTAFADYRSTALRGVSSYAAPSDMALDGNNNLWVTLFDSGSAIKINSATGFVTAVASPSGVSNYFYTLSSDYISLSGYSGESLLLPSSIDTDIDDNIWIAYTHPKYSALVKYRGTNNFTIAVNTLTAIPFPSGISPDQVRIDRNSNVWVTAINHNAVGGTAGGIVNFSKRNDYLYKFDTNGKLQPGYPISGFKQIGNIAIDGNQNAWVIQGAETLTKIDGVTRKQTDYIVGLGRNTTSYICSIGGITCDTSNDIWVINNFDSNIYVIDAGSKATGRLSPKYTIPLYYPSTDLPAASSYTTPIDVSGQQYSDGLKEFQANGDWNGYNWLNKYAARISTIRTITGTSELFNIYPSKGQFNIAKINEEWDASGYYDSLRFQETLLDKQVFFDQFLGVIVGKLDAQPYELGKTVYEKIANFVDNNADIDKVNIINLLSFCEELSIDFEQYNITLPPQLRRLVDLLSIKQSKLWGTINKYGTNFDPRGTMFPNNTYGINLSSIIDPLTGIFFNGTPIVAQETFSQNYKIVNTNFIPGYDINDMIPLSAYTPDWGWGLVAPDVTGIQIKNYYGFYAYNPASSETYYDNIINWNDPQTTLLPTNSSYNSWSKDNGIVQSLLSYEITKGFRLFTSAANITYNS